MRTRATGPTLLLSLVAGLSASVRAEPYEDPDGITGDEDAVLVATTGGSTAPALLATFGGELVRLDQSRQTVFQIPDAENSTVSLQPHLVDEATGRWALSFARQDAGRWTWELATGDQTGMRTSNVQQRTCNKESINCFEEPIGFARKSQDVLVASLTRRGTTVSAVGKQGEARTLVGRSVGTVFAIAPRGDRVVYATRKGLTVAPWSDGVTRGAKQRLAVKGTLNNLMLTEDAVWYMASNANRDTIERIDLTTRKREVVYESRGLVAGWKFHYSTSRDSLLTVESGHEDKRSLVEVSRSGGRTLASDVVQIYDTSADGRFAAIARYGAGGATELAVIDLVTLRDVRVEPGAWPTAAAFVR